MKYFYRKLCDYKNFRYIFYVIFLQYILYFYSNSYFSDFVELKLTLLILNRCLIKKRIILNSYTRILNGVKMYVLSLSLSL